jgi:glycosyltransferase involved in cell wall biosynthesis
MEKKISVITSVFNGEKTIEDTILSVLNQDYSNFELIIVDGLSKDSTIKIVQKYAETDTRIKIISEKDKGIYDAFNKGILNSSGDIIMFVNADDFLFPNALDSINKNFNIQLNDLFAGSLSMINEVDNYNKNIFRSKIPKHSLTNPVILTIGICFNRKVFEKIGYFDITYRVCADVDFIYKCLNNQAKIQYSDILLSYMREGGISSNYKFEFLKKYEQFKAHYNNSIKLDLKYNLQLITKLVKVLILNVLFPDKLMLNKKKIQDKYDGSKIFWFK